MIKTEYRQTQGAKKGTKKFKINDSIIVLPGSGQNLKISFENVEAHIEIQKDGRRYTAFSVNGKSCSVLTSTVSARAVISAIDTVLFANYKIEVI